MSTSQKISWCLSLGRHEKNEKKWYHSPLGLTLKDNSSYIFLGCSGFVSILFVEFQCQCLYATIVGKNFLRIPQKLDAVAYWKKSIFQSKLYYTHRECTPSSSFYHAQAIYIVFWKTFPSPNRKVWKKLFCLRSIKKYKSSPTLKLLKHSFISRACFRQLLRSVPAQWSFLEFSRKL